MSGPRVEVINGFVMSLRLSAAGHIDWSPSDRDTWCEWTEEMRPRLVVVSDLDASQDDLEDVAADIQELVGEDSTIVLRYLPLHDDEGRVAGLLDLLTEEVRDYSTGSLVVSQCDLEHRLLTADARSDLITIIATRAEDDSVLDRVLALMPVDLRAEFAAQCLRGEITPIMPIESNGTCVIGQAELDDVLAALRP